jgi:hypothetical protein
VHGGSGGRHHRRALAALLRVTSARSYRRQMGYLTGTESRNVVALKPVFGSG